MASTDEEHESATEPVTGVSESGAASDATLGAFPVVGIGASAGGLAAFEAFFSGMPADAESGMAFVLVQHLSPDHKSILSELVKRYTSMEVFEVQDGMRVRPNCAYIIPPNRDMAFLHGTLRLLEPAEARGQRLPIDFFFRSLAQDQGEQAVCIVLSGTGSDGTLGVRAIKGEGGMVMIQDPDTAEYDGMPRSALATGLVDYVLPADEMAARLIAYAARAGRGASGTAAPPTGRTHDELEKIFVLIRAQTGHDFSQYKQTTVSRRVERRMAVQQIERLDSYVRYLQQTPSEVNALFRDLLIGVTQFFRDPVAFAALDAEGIAPLFLAAPTGAVIRVWVAGCSTGEEAYSVAILMRERLEATNKSFQLQVFATDIDARAIQVARAGTYPASIVSDISPERLSREFSELDDGSYRVRQAIRDLVIFSEQDMLKDPPFSRLDLVCCRNVMIYMSADLQKKLVPVFHYALNRGGTLFLGSSETVGEFAELFSPLNRKEKIYRRRDDVFGAAHPFIGRAYAPPEARGRGLRPRRPSGESKLPMRELTERALLEETPVAALVNERGELLYVHGHTGEYLEPAPGEAGVNILRMARPGLQHALTGALRQASAQSEPGEPVFLPGLRVKTNGAYTELDLTVRPVATGEHAAGGQHLFLVVFQRARLAGSQAAVASEAGEVPAEPPAEKDARIAALSQELRARDEYLRATQEEMQTSTEELRSANEELQSTNEELQSTNEELETSKEELQSVNEELATVNTELQSKVLDLSQANNDMNNLLAGTGIGTVFVDHQLRIRRFTPAVTQFINLIQTDVGRPLGHIVSNLVSYDGLVADVQAVLDTLAPREIEVETRAGAAYRLRIRPYRTLENVVEGAVITFTEVTALKDAQIALREADALRKLAGALRDAEDAIVVQDFQGRILAFNPSAVRLYGWSEAEALTMNASALVPESQREQALPVVHRLADARVLEPLCTQRLTKGGDIVEIALTATTLVSASGGTYGILTVERGRD